MSSRDVSILYQHFLIVRFTNYLYNYSHLSFLLILLCESIYQSYYSIHPSELLSKKIIICNKQNKKLNKKKIQDIFRVPHFTPIFIQILNYFFTFLSSIYLVHFQNYHYTPFCPKKKFFLSK